MYCWLCLSSLLLSHVPLCRATSNITLNCFTQLCFLQKCLTVKHRYCGTIWPYLKLHFAPSDCGKFISFNNLLGTVNVNTFKLCIILFTLPVCLTELLKCQQLVYGQKQKYVQFVIKLKDLTGMINHMRLCKWWMIYWVLPQSIFKTVDNCLVKLAGRW